MALEVGSVFTRLGFRADYAEADAYDRRVSRIRETARNDIEQKLGAEVDERGFEKFEARTFAARTEARERIEARLGAKLDPAEFDRFARQLDKASAKAKRRDAYKAELGATFDSRAFDAYDRRLEKAERDTRASNARIAAENATVGAAAGGVGGALGGGSSAFSGGIGGLRGALGPLLGILIAILPVIIAVAGAATALGASLTAAAAGAGAVTLGLGAALGPLAAIGGAVASRVGVMQEAWQALGQQQDKSGAQASTAAAAQESASRRVEAAEQGLADAQRGVGLAQDALTGARFRATRQLEDLSAAADRSVISEESASLALKEALKRLAELELDPDASRLQLAEARNQVKVSRADLRAAEVARKRAHEDEARGVDTVDQAERQLSDAKRTRARAADQVRQAEAATTAAITKQGAAANTAEVALGKLSATERHLLSTFRGFSDTLGKTFRPATDAIFAGVDIGLQRLEPVVERYRGRLGRIGDGIGDLLERAAGSLAGPKWKRALDSFVDTAEDIVEPIGEAAGAAIDTVRNIAVAAQPYVREFVDWMRDGLEDLAGKTDDVGKVRDVIGDLVDHTRAWAHFAGAVAVLIYRIFNGSARDGKSLVETMTDIVEKWSAWLDTREGQEAMRRFFRSAIEITKDLAGFIVDFVRQFLKLTTFVGEHREAIELLVKTYITFRAAVVAYRVAAAAAAFVTGGWVTSFWALNAALAANPIGAVIAGAFALGVALGVASKHLDFFGDIATIVFRAMVKQITTFADAFLGMISGVLGGISSFASAASHLPGIGDKFKGLADQINGARSTIDGYRESLRRMGDEHRKAPDPIIKLLNQVSELHARLGTLRKGSDAYNTTAEQLRKKQRQLNDAMGAAQAAGTKGAKGPRAVGKSAKSAAGAVDSANEAIAKGYNQLTEQLGGIKKITYRSSGIVIDRATGSDVTVDTGDITAERRAGGWAPRRRQDGGYGWIGGQAGGQQGPDTIPVLAGAGEAFLETRQQQPIVEDALALRAAMMGGPGSLDELFRQTGGASGAGAYATGGVVGTLRARANRLARIHPAYVWGGGHGVGTIDDREAAAGLDCSGAVGYVLGIPARFSADYRTLGRPGADGEAVVYSNPVHTFMSFVIDGVRKYFGTSGFGHPEAGTGAAWFTRSPTASYLSTFIARTVGGKDVGSGAGSTGIGDLKTPKISGPAGAMRAIAQRAVKRIVDAANNKLATAGAGTGQALRDGAPASTYDGPLDRQFPRHIGPNRKFATLAASAIAMLVRAAGLPEWFSRIILGESGNQPGVQQANPGDNNVGFGLAQNTPHAWDDTLPAVPSIGQLRASRAAPARVMASLGGVPAMFNPVRNLRMARWLLDHAPSKTPNTPGFPWYGTRFLQAGGRVLSRATGAVRRFAKGGFLSGPAYKGLRKTQGQRVKAFEDSSDHLDRLQADYSFADRKFNVSEEVLIDPDTGAVNVEAVTARVRELDELVSLRRGILKQLAEMRTIIARIRATYRTVIGRLRRAMSAISRKTKSGRSRRDKYEAAIKANEGELADWDGKRTQTFDAWRDAGLDVDETVKERNEVAGTKADLSRVDEPEPPADPGSDPGGSGGDTGPGATAPPTAEEIAAAAAQQFAAFNAARDALFATFGANFVQAGQPIGGDGLTGLGAGLRAFGATGANGLAAAANGPGGLTINLTNNYAGGPDDPHTYAQGQRAELLIAMGG